MEYLVAPGQPNFDYVAFENPLEGSSLVLTKALDYETMKSFRVRIVARDRGVPALGNETDITIDVTDADDQVGSWSWKSIPPFHILFLAVAVSA